MTRTKHLQEQAARAERLARSILDTVTVERLQAFAAECRAQAKTLDEPEAARLTYFVQNAADGDTGLHQSVQLREINRRA
jgi:uncharacterized surface protein with fasciclin (FAS1) repeats